MLTATASNKGASMAQIDSYQPTLVILAVFMRILTPASCGIIPAGY